MTARVGVANRPIRSVNTKLMFAGNCMSEITIMKEKTRQLLDAAKARRKKLPKGFALFLIQTKEVKREQRKMAKARKAIAARLREIRRNDGHHLARVWARAGGC